MNALVLPNGIVIDDAMFDRIKTASIKTMKDAAPNPNTRYKTSTGNLALNSIKLKDVNRKSMRFTVYVDVEKAPYMPYVNSKTHWADGRSYEYNEWFDKAVEEVANYIADIVGGKVIKS